MKSQASASSQPPPSAKPLTAAITGTRALSIVAERRPARRPRTPAPPSAIELGHRRDVGAGDERAVARAGQDRAADVGVDGRWRRTPRAPPPASAGRGALSAASRAIVSIARGHRARRGRRSVVRSCTLLCPARRTRRTRGAPCARASPRRRTGGAAGTAGTCHRRARGAAPRAIARHVSRPIRSISASGPIGWLRPERDRRYRCPPPVPSPSYRREAGLVEHRHQHAG